MMASSTLASDKAKDSGNHSGSGKDNDNPSATRSPWSTLRVPEQQQQNQDQDHEASSIALEDRLCFVELKKKNDSSSSLSTSTSTSSYWWPAVLYYSLEEFQSSHKHELDQHAKVSLSTKLMQQHLEHAKSGRPPRGSRDSGSGDTTNTTITTDYFYVARLLGKPLSDLQILGHDERYQDYHLFLHQILPLTFCQPKLFHSTQDYLNFHKGLDQAAAILMQHMNKEKDTNNVDMDMNNDIATTTATTTTNMHAPPPPQLDGFYLRAQKALLQEPQEEHEHADEQHEQREREHPHEHEHPPNSPVGDRSVAAVSISNESWISANHNQRHHGHAGDDAATVMTASSPLPGAAADADADTSTVGDTETPSRQPPSPLSISIPTQAPWEAVWTELQFQGWTCQKSTLGVNVSRTGSEVLYRRHNQDQGMPLEALQSDMRRHHGWTGPPPLPRLQNASSASASALTASNHRPVRASRRVQPPSLLSQQGRAQQQQQQQRQDQFYKFGILWKHILKGRLGWTMQKGPGGIVDWIYLRSPGVSIKTGTLGVDFFHSADQVLDYCRDHNYHELYNSGNESRSEESSSSEEDQDEEMSSQEESASEDEASHDEVEDNDDEQQDAAASSLCPSEKASHDEYMSDHDLLSDSKEETDVSLDGEAPSTPVDQRTVPQDSGNPLLSPASSDSSSSIDSEAYRHYKFSNVWMRLKRVGWMYITPPRPYRDFDAQWYVRPDFDWKKRKEENYQEDVHYFKSAGAVVEWVKRTDQLDEQAKAKNIKKKTKKVADGVSNDELALLDNNRKKRALKDVSKNNNNNKDNEPAPKKRGRMPKDKDSSNSKADDSGDAKAKPLQGRSSKALKKDSSNNKNKSNSKSFSPTKPSEVSKKNAKNMKNDCAKKEVVSFTIGPHRNKAPWAQKPLPKARKLWPLCERVGFVHSGGQYYFPDESPRSFEHRFTNLDDLQSYMVSKGIPNLESLSPDEQEKITYWVKYANIPHRIGEAQPEEIRLITNPEVTELLTEKLSFKQQQSSGADGWKAGEKSCLSTFEFYNLSHVRRVLRGITDLEEACRPDTGGKRRRNVEPLLNHEELLALRLWLASSSAPLPVFGASEDYNQKMDIDDEEQEDPSQDQEEAAQSSSDEDSLSSKSDVDEPMPSSDEGASDDGAMGDEMDQVEDVEEASNARVEMEEAVNALDLVKEADVASPHVEKELAEPTCLHALPDTQELANQEALDEAKDKRLEIKNSLPRWKVCWKILQEIGFRYSGGNYILPGKSAGPDRFSNEKDLNRFLCKTGIPNYRKTASLLSQQQRQELERTIRHAYVPTVQSWTQLGDHILTDDEALALLQVLKFEIVGDQHFFPRAGSLPGHHNPVHGFHFVRGIRELRVLIRTTGDLLQIGREETGPSGRSQRAKLAKKSGLNKKQLLSLHLWAAETEDPLPDFPDQPDPVDKVESTEPSSTEVQDSSKSEETSSVKIFTMEDSSTDSGQEPDPNNGASIVKPPFHQHIAEEPKSEQDNEPKTFSSIPQRVHEDMPMLDKPVNDTVETADPAQYLNPAEEPASKNPGASNSILSTPEPVIEGNPMLHQIADKHRDSSDDDIVAGTSDPSSVACSDTLGVLKESSPESCQEDPSNDAMNEHTIDSDAQSPEVTASTEEPKSTMSSSSEPGLKDKSKADQPSVRNCESQVRNEAPEDVADTGDRIPMEKRDYDASQNGDDAVGAQESVLPTVSFALKPKGNGMADTKGAQAAGDHESVESKAHLACEIEETESALQSFHSEGISDTRAPTANSHEKKRIRVVDRVDSFSRLTTSTVGVFDARDASCAEPYNGQDAANHNYGYFLTQPMDEDDDTASDYPDDASASHYPPPTRDGKPRVSYEPGEAQPFGDEASYQEDAVDRRNISLPEGFEIMGSFDFSSQERTKNDRNDSGSTYPMTQPDAENDLFGHMALEHEEDEPGF